MIALSLDKLIEKIGKGPEVGMIACHLGIVRGYTSSGEPIKYMNVRYNREALNDLLNNFKKYPGIKDILVEVAEGRRQIGDWIMAVLIAGDNRQHTLLVLERLIELIKRSVIKEEECKEEKYEQQR